ncbi:MAG: NAD(P)-dependent oxidoreductase [Saccharofermentans sp.]|nr:NAD(P)-dependent oxidoreductase [Saccharofermentans sp.]
MKTAVITGANGFVGFALLSELLSHDYNIIALIRPSSVISFNNKLKGLSSGGLDISRVEILPVDLGDFDEMRHSLRNTDASIDAFYHLAWNGSSGLKRRDIDLQLSNVNISVQLIRIASDLECKTFVGAGSITEDVVLKMSYERGGKTTLDHLYSTAKLESHLTSQIIAQKEGLDFRWAKITNAYGAGENESHLVPSTLKKLINGEPCEFIRGDQLYDFVYVTDVARAFRLIGENGKNMEVYHIGSGKAAPLKSFIDTMYEVTGSNSPLDFSGDPEHICYLPKTTFSIDTLTRDTGFAPEVSFEEGVRKTLEAMH